MLAIAVTITAISFVSGISAWKREFIGKRNIELAESILALFYEAEDAIREIRNPFGHVGEGATRKRADNEREEETEILDQAYVFFERYQKREKLFAELRSMKYRAMATFGSDASQPFDELNKVLSEIFNAAHTLGTYYWQTQRRAPIDDKRFEKRMVDMQKQEAIFWSLGKERDEIGPRVHKIVENIEHIASKAISSRIGLLEKIKIRNNN